MISQAGAEGLDFKFIRQVHILEPWYNLSRIEQIIGRAVRHCSHKNLPFEKRNVEIFLYGSRLENLREEAADLYVYRLAEIKAIKIGEVNRVLKEISVDCLLNSEQLNFSEEKLQQTVVQILSNGNSINYNVGDKPYSEQCDYMERCLYQCKPSNIIGDINELSYSEAFIEMNTEKIIHRIKQLMKEHFFYEKRDLITQINIIKSYPLIQIYAALTQLVTDKNEFITDKYGRLGTLINIGDYYFFQPSELNNDNISIFERSTPIPFKHANISYNVSEEIEDKPLQELAAADAVETIEAIEADEPDEADEPGTSSAIPDLETAEEALHQSTKITTTKEIPPSIVPEVYSGKKVLLTMFKDYNIANAKQVIVRGETNWYKYSHIILDSLEKEGIQKEILEELLIKHIY